MRIPPIGIFSTFGVLNCNNMRENNKNDFIKPLKSDTISFSSNVRYIKKYNTLPDEIKKILNPKDAIDMFKDMEWVAKGVIKRGEIGEGENSKVYKNPWLEDYYLLVLDNDKDYDTITVYSGESIGNSIWQDADNKAIQILKRASWFAFFNPNKIYLTYEKS